MNLHDDPRAVFRQAMPEATPSDAPFDLDRIVQDGYRARRRHRAVLGAAATTGVAAVAAVLALSVVGLPGGSADPADDPTGAEQPASDGEPSMSGYPYAPNDEFGSDEERALLHDGAMLAFKPLLDGVGVVLTDDVPLEFMANQTPGNYGQTWLRSYTTGASNAEEGDGDEDVVFRLEAMLPGGWTAEPGPVTEQLFPQHLISAGGDPWYEDADWTDELVTTDLDDGRTLITVDHECAFEAAVVYPNGSALRGSWDMGCHEESPEYVISLEEFAAAMTAMPEVDYDTSELTPVGELTEVPVGWLYDPEWEQSEATENYAADSIASAQLVLQGFAPGVVLYDTTATQLGMTDRGSVVTRSYWSTGALPEEVTGGYAAEFDLQYYLPGGWVPGIGEPDERGLYAEGCMPDSTCSETTDSDGTVWAFQVYAEVERDEEEGDESDADQDEFQVIRFDPEGWAVSITVSTWGETLVDADLIGDYLRAMPAPEYDAEETPQIPAD